jgi:hypothetical protein
MNAELKLGEQADRYTLGWPDALFWEEGSAFEDPKNYINLMGKVVRVASNCLNTGVSFFFLSTIWLPYS